LGVGKGLDKNFPGRIASSGIWVRKPKSIGGPTKYIPVYRFDLRHENISTEAKAA
jgi:hypothetical protein